MNERPSHIEGYRAMTPQQRNAEMKGLFMLAPPSHASHNKRLLFSQTLDAWMKNLLSFAVVTDSFKSFIVNRFEPDRVKRWVSPENTRLFQWDNPESGGIFDEIKTKEIEKRAYGLEVKRQLTMRRIALTAGVIKENGEKKEIDQSGKERLRFERMFMSEYERKLEQQRDREVGEMAEKIRREKEFIVQWRLDFIQMYGDEP